MHGPPNDKGQLILQASETLADNFQHGSSAIKRKLKKLPRLSGIMFPTWHTSLSITYVLYWSIRRASCAGDEVVPYNTRVDDEVTTYNRADVMQQALHANTSGSLSGPWQGCSDYVQYSRLGSHFLPLLHCDPSSFPLEVICHTTSRLWAQQALCSKAMDLHIEIDPDSRSVIRVQSHNSAHQKHSIC